MSIVNANYDQYGVTPPNLNNSGNNSSISGSVSGGEFGMNTFMKLLAAQMTNQDPMNPASDTEFIGQMAQFTALQTSQTAAEISYAQYGTNMVGKRVHVFAQDKKTGQPTEDTGIVDKCELLNGKCTVTVNDKEYDLSSVMYVVTPDYKIPDKDDGEEDPEVPLTPIVPPATPEHPIVPPEVDPPETPDAE